MLKTPDVFLVPRRAVGEVSFVRIARPATLHRGSLSDIAPTVLSVMGIAQPVEMTGRALIEFQ